MSVLSIDRLTQTSDLGGVAFTFDLEVTCQPSEMKKILRLAEKLKEYEDAEEQGLLLRLPCKVGDTVYLINTKFEVVPRTADMMFLGVLWDEYEKTWFLTQAEAEQKLKEMESEQN